MKKIKLALALASLMTVSSATVAQNSIDTVIGMNAYIAAGLGFTTEQGLQFGRMVKTEGGTGKFGVEIYCGGEVVGINTLPPGIANNEATTPMVGKIAVKGEKDSYISVDIAADEPGNGVEFTLYLDDDCNKNTTFNEGEAKLDDNGDFEVTLYGKLLAPAEFTGAISTDINVIVAYR